jgi:hypothetical protein
VEILMRAAQLSAPCLALGLAACSPQISSGAYDCGPNESCPSGESCNADATCVTTGTQAEFACDPSTLHEPDDTPAQAYAITVAGCVSPQYELMGCLQAGDPANWISFATPSNCTAVGVTVSVVFPIAFEPLAMQLTDATGATTLASNTACAKAPTYAGDASTCLTATLSDAASYALSVVPAGSDDCGGSCNFSNYTLTLQLVTP